jgi:hypothetical protein
MVRGKIERGDEAVFQVVSMGNRPPVSILYFGQVLLAFGVTGIAFYIDSLKDVCIKPSVL